MRWPRLEWSGTLAPAALAALTSWVALWSWAGFVQSPSGFLVPALAAALVVGATGALLRALRAPLLAVLPAQVGAVTVWLLHDWVPETMVGGWLPTPGSVSEALALLADGVTAAQSYAAPVPDSAPDIHVLLIAAGVLVTLLVDFFACGLRRVPIAGLPLLAVYTAPVSILVDGVPWWTFAAGAAGFLALMVSEEGRRLRHWGRQVARSTVADSGEGVVGTVSIHTSARRIGFTATALAVVAPAVVPTLGGTLLPGGPGDGEGGDSVRITNPMVNLRRDLVRGQNVELVRVTTTNADPSYLRISVLDEFGGSTWKPSDRDIPPEQRADGRMPEPPGLARQVARRQVDYELTVEDVFYTTWLPTPYPVRSIDVPGDWRYDKETFDFISAVRGEGAAGVSYSLTAFQVTPSTQDLLDSGPPPSSIFSPFTELPDDIPDMVAELAREVTAGAGTRFEKAVRLQRWFRSEGGFEYSLDREPGNGTDDLVTFLSEGFGGREGYCEQFAAAMAVMGRTIGIPSRVAVGFLRPSKVGPNEYVYRAHDLHAWPEMYFDGVGWVRFEPTPGDRARTIPGYTTGQFDTPEPAAVPSASPGSRAQDEIARNRRLDEESVAAALDDGTGGGGGGGAVLPLALGGALLFAPWAARSLVRRRRWRSPRTAAELAEAAWRELRDVVLDLGVPWDESVTLRTRARDVAAGFGRPGDDPRQGYVRGGRGPEASPEAARALERLVRDLEVARYSRHMPSPADRTVADVRRDVALCEVALRAGVSRKRRRVATWLPASLVRNGAWRSVLSRRGVGTAPLAEAGVDRAV